MDGMADSIPLPFCWKKKIDLGHLFGCADTHAYVGEDCVEKCKAGYEMKGTTCFNKCPEGTIDSG